MGECHGFGVRRGIARARSGESARESETWVPRGLLPSSGTCDYAGKSGVVNVYNCLIFEALSVLYIFKYDEKRVLETNGVIFAACY